MKIPENIVGRLYKQNSINEFEGPFKEFSLRKFKIENSTYDSQVYRDQDIKDKFSDALYNTAQCF